MGKLVITQRHSPQGNSEDSNMKIKCEIHWCVVLYIENCTRLNGKKLIWASITESLRFDFFSEKKLKSVERIC